MSSRTLSVLVVVTGLLVVAASIMYARRTPTVVSQETELLYPQLEDRVNDVAALAVRGASESFRVVRAGEAWELAEKDGYPVQFEKVKEAVVGLSQLRLVEPKTSRPDRYESIGVDDPDREGSAATLVTLLDADDQELASLILGNRDFQSRQQRRYVRKQGQEQSWLVDGRLEVDGTALNWVDRELVRLPRNRVQRVTIGHPDGERLEIDRDSESQRNFTIQDIPEGYEPQREGVADGVGSALSFLRMEDVASVETPTEAAITETRFTTFDGLEVTLRIWSVEGEEDTPETVWTTIAASAPEVDDEGDEAEASDEGDASAVDEAGSGDQDEPSVREQMQTINDRCDGWMFAISASTAGNLRKRMDELTQAIAPEEPEATEEVEDPGAGAPAGQEAGEDAEGPAEPTVEDVEDQPADPPTEDGTPGEQTDPDSTGEGGGSGR